MIGVPDTLVARAVNFNFNETVVEVLNVITVLNVIKS